MILFSITPLCGATYDVFLFYYYYYMYSVQTVSSVFLLYDFYSSGSTPRLLHIRVKRYRLGCNADIFESM